MIKLVKEERNEQGQVTYREWSDGSWEKYEYDNKGNATYLENSYGYWTKRECDETGKVIYCETSKSGVLYDYRDKDNISFENEIQEENEFDIEM